MATQWLPATLLAGVLCLVATQAASQSVALPRSATRIEIAVFKDSWTLEGRIGGRYSADLPNPNQTLWYTFTMPKDGVIFLQNYSTEKNYSTLELFDSRGKDPDPTSWLDSAPRRAFNGRIRKGDYYLRIMCPKGCKEAVVTELARFEE
jgi:hypothetical protein